MKLLDLPHHVADATIYFDCSKSWDSFDKTVIWLVQNGVALEWDGKRIHAQSRTKRPYVSGDVVNQKVVPTQPTSVYGEEHKTYYVVAMPRFRR